MLITTITVLVVILTYSYLAKRLWKINFFLPISILLQVVLFIGFAVLWVLLQRYGFIQISLPSEY